MLSSALDFGVKERLAGFVCSDLAWILQIFRRYSLPAKRSDTFCASVP
jgi:hypothetical protein